MNFNLDKEDENFNSFFLGLDNENTSRGRNCSSKKTIVHDLDSPYTGLKKTWPKNLSVQLELPRNG